MNPFFTLLKRLHSALRPDQLHEEISEELRFHIEMKTADLVRQGTPPEQALALAQRSFGSATRIGETGYDVRGHQFLEQITSDIRFALRLLRKRPARSAVLIATVALGIGLNTAVFVVLRSLLLEPLPFRQSSELVVLHQANHEQLSGVSYPHFQDWQAQSRSFTDLAVYTATSGTLTGSSEPVRLSGAIVSASLFRLLGVQPLRGRLFREPEDRLITGPQSLTPLLISDRLWQARFDGRGDILGQTVHLDGHGYTIIGILPDRFAFPIQKDPVEYWSTVAVDADPARYGGSIPTSRGYPRYDGAVARLKPGVTPAKAEADLQRVAANIAREHPHTTSANEIALVPALREIVGPSSRTMILLLYGAVFCVLLVACVNVANLLLVDALARRREFSLRTALGAPAAHLVRQLLVESVVLALAGGAASLFVATAVLHLFIAFAPAETPRLTDIHFSLVTLLYVFAITVLSGLLFGCLPALSVRRQDLASVLKEGAVSVARKASVRQPGPLLVCGQIALSLVLISSAALLVASFDRILHAGRGFNPHGLLTASISLPVSSYGQNSRRVATFYRDLLQQLRTIPGVQTATAAEVLPLSGESNGTTVQLDGVPDPGLPGTDLRFVEPEYFRTLQISLVGGRLFNAQDEFGHLPCAIVNQAFVRRFLQGRDAYQTDLKLGWGGNGRKRIIGVVSNVRPSAISPVTAPEVYVPLAQFPLNDISLLLRTSVDPETLATPLRNIVHRLDPALPVDRIRALDDYLLLSSEPQQFLMWILVAFALTTLLLAAVGLYGVLSEVAISRTQEFGIRLALGASRERVMRMVLTQGLILTLAGLFLGSLLTRLTSRALTRWLYDTAASDPVTLTLSAGVLFAVALVACYGPAHRAARIDPASSLRAS